MLEAQHDSRIIRNNSYWECLHVPLQPIDPTGLIEAPMIDAADPSASATAVPGTLLFSGLLDSLAAGVAVLPHSWVEGTGLYPSIHWALMADSAATVTWELRARLLGDPEQSPSAWTIMTIDTSKNVGSSTAQVRQTTAWQELSMASKKVSTMVALALYRRGATDANNDTVRLYGLDLHYRANSLGSDLELRKTF